MCSPVPPPQVALKPVSHLAQGTQTELSQGATWGAEAQCHWVEVPPALCAQLPSAPPDLHILVSACLSLLAVLVPARPVRLAGKAAVVAVLFCHSQKVNICWQ